MKTKRILACITAVMISTTFISIPKIKSNATTSKEQATEIVSKMTMDEKIGQILMTDFRQWKTTDGTVQTDLIEMNSEVAEIVNKYHLGGVILFANNVKETQQTAKLAYDFQQAAINGTNKNLPLLLTIDQEGGIVTRLGTGTNLPGNMALGATRSTDDAYNSGYIMGRELKALGINVDFAPAMDVNNNPANPVIGLRSFSSDAQLVAKLGTEVIKGIQSQGVATAAKHFPGHGDTATDSHVGLPLVDKSIEQLRQNELIPFKAAVDQGVDMLMTAHIQYPQIEKDTYTSKKDGTQVSIPATLSDDIIQGVIRNELGYDGVVVTDALNMAAISANFGEVDAVELAIKSGVDIALMPTILRTKQDLTKLDAIYDGLKSAINTGEISMDRINEAAIRVVKTKIDRGVINEANDTRTLDQRIAYAKAVVGCVEHRNMEREIAADAITVLKNDENTLPIKTSKDDNILLLAGYSNELPGLKYGISRLQNEGVINNNLSVTAMIYNKNIDLTDEIKSAIDKSDTIILLTEMSSMVNTSSWVYSFPLKAIEYANSQNKTLIVSSVDKPYDATLYSDAKVLVSSYGYKGMDPTEGGQGVAPVKAFGPNIPAIVDIVFGAHEAEGTLPVAIPTYSNGAYDLTKNVYEFGHGLTYLTNKGTTSLDVPTEIKAGEEVTLKVELQDIYSLSSKGFSFNLLYNTEAFDFVKAEGVDKLKVTESKIENNLLKVNVISDDIIPENAVVNVVLKAKKTSNIENIDVREVKIIDNKDREYTASNAEGTIKINAATVIDGNNNNSGQETSNTNSELTTENEATASKTGDSIALVIVLSLIMITSAAVLIKFRNNRNKKAVK